MSSPLASCREVVYNKGYKGGGVYLFKRIRYYQGMIDRHNLQKSEHYSKLPESFIIMICTKDLIGRGMAVYKRWVTVEGCEDYAYEDGSHVYLLNSAYTVANAENAILEFLNCIRTNNANADDYSSQLMKEICPAMGEVQSDPGKEAEYMTWQTRLMDTPLDDRQLKHPRPAGKLIDRQWKDL